MVENYVNRVEFDALKEEVKAIKSSMEKNSDLLIEIDKKVTVIGEKISNANDNEKLKLDPLEKRIDEVKDNQKWLWRTCGATVIGLIIKYWIG